MQIAEITGSIGNGFLWAGAAIGTVTVFLGALATHLGARYSTWRSAFAVFFSRRGQQSFDTVSPKAAILTVAAVAALFAGAVIASVGSELRPGPHPCTCALPSDWSYAP